MEFQRKTSTFTKLHWFLTFGLARLVYNLVGSHTGFPVKRTLVMFDTSSLPVGAQVVDATVNLHTKFATLTSSVRFFRCTFTLCMHTVLHGKRMSHGFLVTLGLMLWCKRYVITVRG